MNDIGMTDIDRLFDLLRRIRLGCKCGSAISLIALAEDRVRLIRDDLDGLAFNEKHLRKDCERLRRELDDEMGIIR